MADVPMDMIEIDYESLPPCPFLEDGIDWHTKVLNLELPLGYPEDMMETMAERTHRLYQHKLDTKDIEFCGVGYYKCEGPVPEVQWDPETNQLLKFANGSIFEE